MANSERIPTPYSYSAAVVAGDYVFLSLHRGFGADFTTQFHDVMARLKKTLAELNLTLVDLVKVNVWLKDIKNVRIYEQLFKEYYEEGTYPARMGATTQFVDDDCLLMIEGTAYRGKPV